ncbi:MAG: hypothetical protein AAFZ92_00075 [Pseudomonadota bacterium]
MDGSASGVNANSQPANQSTGTGQVATSASNQFAEAATATNGESIRPGNTISGIERLEQREHLYSPEGNTLLRLAGDGNLILYNTQSEHFNDMDIDGSGKAALWQSVADHMDNKSGAFAQFHPHGSWIVFNKNGDAHKTINTGNPGANRTFFRLEVGDTIPLKVVDDLTGTTLWQVNSEGEVTQMATPIADEDYFSRDHSLGSTLDAGEVLVAGKDHLLSADGLHQFSVTHSGTFFKRHVKTGDIAIIEETGVVGGRLTTNAQGNMVLLNSDGKIGWSTETGDLSVNRSGDFSAVWTNEAELLLLDNNDGDRLLWRSEQGLVQLALSNADKAFSPTLNGRVEGDNAIQRDEDAQAERWHLHYLGLMSQLDGVPGMTAQQTVLYTLKEEFGELLYFESHQWHAFLDANIVDNRFTGIWDVSMLKTAYTLDNTLLTLDLKRVEQSIKDAVGLLYVIQQNHHNPDLNGFVLPPEAMVAHGFFARVLFNDIMQSGTTDFLSSRISTREEAYDINGDGDVNTDDIHWINTRNQGFLYATDGKIDHGLFELSELAGTVTAMALEWIGREVTEEMGSSALPSTEDLDRSDLLTANDGKFSLNVVHFDYTDENGLEHTKTMVANVDDMARLNAQDNAGDITIISETPVTNVEEGRAYWWEQACLHNESQRTPIYNDSGELISGASIEVRLAHLICLLHKHFVDNGALDNKSFSHVTGVETLEYDDDLGIAITVPERKDYEGSSLDTFVDNIALTDTVSTLTDAEALAGMYQILNMNQQEQALGVVGVINKGYRGLVHTLDMGAYFGSAFSEHPYDGASAEDQLDNLDHTYHIVGAELRQRGRPTAELDEHYHELKDLLKEQRHQEHKQHQIDIGMAAATTAMAFITLFSPLGLAFTVGTEVAYSALSTSEEVALAAETSTPAASTAAGETAQSAALLARMGALFPRVGASVSYAYPTLNAGAFVGKALGAGLLLDAASLGAAAGYDETLKQLGVLQATQAGFGGDLADYIPLDPYNPYPEQLLALTFTQALDVMELQEELLNLYYGETSYYGATGPAAAAAQWYQDMVDDPNISNHITNAALATLPMEVGLDIASHLPNFSLTEDAMKMAAEYMQVGDYTLATIYATAPSAPATGSDFLQWLGNTHGSGVAAALVSSILTSGTDDQINALILAMAHNAEAMNDIIVALVGDRDPNGAMARLLARIMTHPSLTNPDTLILDWLDLLPPFTAGVVAAAVGAYFKDDDELGNEFAKIIKDLLDPMSDEDYQRFIAGVQSTSAPTGTVGVGTSALVSAGVLSVDMWTGIFTYLDADSAVSTLMGWDDIPFGAGVLMGLMANSPEHFAAIIGSMLPSMAIPYLLEISPDGTGIDLSLIPEENAVRRAWEALLKFARSMGMNPKAAYEYLSDNPTQIVEFLDNDDKELWALITSLPYSSAIVALVALPPARRSEIIGHLATPDQMLPLLAIADSITRDSLLLAGLPDDHLIKITWRALETFAGKMGITPAEAYSSLLYYPATLFDRWDSATLSDEEGSLLLFALPNSSVPAIIRLTMEKDLHLTIGAYLRALLLLTDSTAGPQYTIDIIVDSLKMLAPTAIGKVISAIMFANSTDNTLPANPRIHLLMTELIRTMENQDGTSDSDSITSFIVGTTSDYSDSISSGAGSVLLSLDTELAAQVFRKITEQDPRIAGDILVYLSKLVDLEDEEERLPSLVQSIGENITPAVMAILKDPRYKDFIKGLLPGLSKLLTFIIDTNANSAPPQAAPLVTVFSSLYEMAESILPVALEHIDTMVVNIVNSISSYIASAFFDSLSDITKSRIVNSLSGRSQANFVKVINSPLDW